jgi:methyl-accepting chemotaxis protein
VQLRGVIASSIKNVLFAACGCLAVLAIAGFAWQSTGYWSAYAFAVAQRDFDAGTNRFVKGLFTVLLERLETNNALQAPEPASPAVRAKIDAFRKTVRENFDPGLAVLQGRDFPDRAALLSTLQTTLRKADDYRRQADAALKLPRDDRDANLRKTFIPVVTDSVNAALKVWYAALHETARTDPHLARLAHIKEIGWRMREYSGHERSIVAASMAGAAAISPEGLAAADGHRARVAVLWDQLQNLTAGADTPAAIGQAMQNARTGYFKDFLALADSMRKASTAGAKYPISAAQWVEATNPQIDTLLAVMYAAGEASEAATARKIDGSLRDLEIALALMATTVAMVILCAWIVVARVTRPLALLTTVVDRLAANDTAVEIPRPRRADEIGRMNRALVVFRDSMVDCERRRAEQHETDLRLMAERRASEEREVAQAKAATETAAAERRRVMQEMADGFESAVRDIVNGVSAAATELEATAATLTTTAVTTQKLSAQVAGASQQSSGNVLAVASSTEELNVSVDEIGRRVQESSNVARQAVKQAEGTDTRIAALSQAAGRIGDIVKLITAIAEQTNLLALNATIEAARAGEAGKGFAVVAQEVKALAAQTAKATQDISTQIAGMQAATDESVVAIKEIGATIGRISEISAAIAASVEEQGAATREIARNVNETARGAAQIAANIGEVSRGASETGSASAQMLASAQSLASESNHLKVEVRRFLDTVRAA